MQVFPQSMSGNRAKASVCCFLRLRHPPEAESFTEGEKKHPKAYTAKLALPVKAKSCYHLRVSKYFKEAKNGKERKDSHQTEGL